MEGERKSSPGVIKDIQEVEKERNYTATFNKMRWHPRFIRSRVLFISHAFQSMTPTGGLLPTPSTGKLPLISAGPKRRYSVSICEDN